MKNIEVGVGKEMQKLIDQELTQLKAENAELKQLISDSATLHTNILRGTVQLDRAAALHIAGAADYDELRRRTDWTPVGQRRPKEPKRYQITVYAKLPNGMDSTSREVTEAYFVPSCGFKTNVTVIAWREMPAPYQGDTK